MKKLFISPELILQMFTEGRRHSYRVAKGIPPGARVQCVGQLKDRIVVYYLDHDEPEAREMETVEVEVTVIYTPDPGELE